MHSQTAQLESGRSFITVAGATLESLWLPGEAGTGTTWILLHEGLGCIELWRDFPHLLRASTGESVFVYSRQGYGSSDPVPLPRPLDYMEREATRVLGPVIDQVPGQRIILLGHSDGGSITAVHAGLCPHPRLTGALLVAPHFFTESIALGAIRAAKIAFDTGELRQRLAHYHFANVDCAFNGWCNAWLDEGFLDWDIRSCLSSVEIPMLLVQGDRDRYGTLLQLDTAAKLASGWVQQRVLTDCDHSPHREAPEELLKACHCLRDNCLT